MNVRFRVRRTAALLLAGALVPLAAPAPAASADVGPNPLRLLSYGDLAVDEAGERLYLSRGVAGDGVLVTDLSGTYVTEIPLPGAHGMAMAPDGRSLWVAQPAGLLSRVDLGSGGVAQQISVPTGHCPGDVAVVGDRLVYGHSCSTYGAGGSYGGVGVVGTDGTPYGSVNSGPFHTPVVAAGPAGQVYAGDTGSSPTGLYLYDVTQAQPVLVAERAQVCENLRDLVARPDGAQVVTACGYPYQHEVYSGTKLGTLGSYPSGAYPLAGAWSADAGTFAAGLDAAYEPDLYVYAAGDRSLRREVDFGSTSELLQPRGLAVSRDGSRVWAVTGTRTSTGGTAYALRVFDQDGPTATSLGLVADPPDTYAGQATTLGGRLVSGGAGVGGALLTVTRTGTAAGTRSDLPAVTTAADGTYHFSDSPPYADTWTYEVSYAGDGLRRPATATAQVVAHPVMTQVSLALTSPSVGTVAGTVQLRADDPALVAGREVVVSRTGSTFWASLTTDASGLATFSEAPGTGTFTYTAALRGVQGLTESSATQGITLAKQATDLTATAPAEVKVGEPIPLSGRLSSSGAGLGGAALLLTRSGCGQWQASLTTGADGSWSASDTTATAGTCTYSVSYGGTSTLDASKASAGVVVQKRTTTLSLDVVRGTGSTKKYAYITAKLGAWRSNTVLTITAQPVGGSEVVLVRGSVDTSGVLKATYQPKTTTTYRATYAGDEWYLPASAERTQ